MSPVTDVDAYLAGVPSEQRPALDEVRRLVKGLVPDAVEGIAYGMPAYKYRGKPLVYYGSAKHHWALYGLVPEGLEEQLKQYETSKGTIRIPVGDPVPEALIRSLLSTRTAEIDAKTKSAPSKRGSGGAKA